ncbi:MAG: PLP-dependent transferase [Ruminococcus bromii]|nr:PLP-dependent transferase [Ruminococcus bromii]
MEKNFKPDTICIHAGYKPGNGEPRVLPIVQSTTYTYESSQEMGDLFDLKSDGFFYTRLGNPTLDAVEKKLAALEGGVGAMLTASGQSASLLAVLNICRAGGHVVCSSAIYGGTFNLFYKTMKEMGIDFTFVSPTSTADELRAAFRENTRCVFAETLANPSLVVTDLELFANIAHEHGVPIIVDNTFPTPINCRPFEFGVDIVVHSTTKYLDGHAVQVGGAIVDSGNFDWNNGKFPEFTEPDESYHGVVYTKQFGRAAYIAKARCHLMRDLGAQAAPMNAFLLNLGMETLALRMERHCSNAMEIAKFLEQDDRIAWVNFPGLESSPFHALAQKYMPHGTCGVVSFGIKGGREAATKFMDSLELASVVTHVADLRTCVLHPASTTHRQLSDKQLEEAGVSPDLIRLSVGIENIDDILADIKQALEKAVQ